MFIVALSFVHNVTFTEKKNHTYTHARARTDERRRAEKELNRKGGRNEGVHWFSAASLKAKLEAQEEQWRRDTERQLAANEAQAVAIVAERAEQQLRLEADAADKHLRETLDRQKEDRLRTAEADAATAKAE